MVVAAAVEVEVEVVGAVGVRRRPLAAAAAVTAATAAAAAAAAAAGEAGEAEAEAEEGVVPGGGDGGESGLVESNFLCVHKKLRSKRLAPVLIKEITRRVNRRGLFQAAYTAGVVLPKPVARCRYWHRSLNPKKLIEVGFSRLAPRMTTTRTINALRASRRAADALPPPTPSHCASRQGLRRPCCAQLNASPHSRRSLSLSRSGQRQACASRTATDAAAAQRLPQAVRRSRRRPAAKPSRSLQPQPSHSRPSTAAQQPQPSALAEAVGCISRLTLSLASARCPPFAPSLSLTPAALAGRVPPLALDTAGPSPFPNLVASSLSLLASHRSPRLTALFAFHLAPHSPLSLPFPRLLCGRASSIPMSSRTRKPNHTSPPKPNPPARTRSERSERPLRASLPSSHSFTLTSLFALPPHSRRRRQITDMVSFYSLPSSILGHDKHRTLFAAYSYALSRPAHSLSRTLHLSLSRSAIAPTPGRVARRSRRAPHPTLTTLQPSPALTSSTLPTLKALHPHPPFHARSYYYFHNKTPLSQLMNDALILAKRHEFDVFNALVSRTSAATAAAKQPPATATAAAAATTFAPCPHHPAPPSPPSSHPPYPCPPLNLHHHPLPWHRRLAPPQDILHNEEYPLHPLHPWHRRRRAPVLPLQLALPAGAAQPGRPRTAVEGAKMAAF